MNKWSNYNNDPTIVKDLTLGLIRINLNNNSLTLKRTAYEIEEIFVEFEGKNYMQLWGMSLDDIYFLNEGKLVGDPLQVKEKVIELTDESKVLAERFLKVTEIKI